MSMLPETTALSIIDKIAVPLDPFTDVRDKRMSELTPEQKDRAHELWLRENVGYFTRETQDGLKAVFRVIDRLRASS